MPSFDRMGVAGAWCPSKVLQRKRSQLLPSGDIPQPTWQDKEEAESLTAWLSLDSCRCRNLGGGCVLSLPSLPLPFRDCGEQAATGQLPTLGLGKQATSLH